MPQTSRGRPVTPLRYAFRSLHYRKGGLLRALASLSLLLIYLTVLGGVVEGVDREITELSEAGEAPSKDLLDFRDTMGSWYTFTFVLYSLLMLFLALTYFSMVAVARGEESHLLKSLGFSRWEVDTLFLLEALLLTCLTAVISLAVAIVFTPIFPRIFKPFGIQFRATFQPLTFLQLTLVLVVTASAGAVLGGEISQRERRVAV